MGLGRQRWIYLRAVNAGHQRFAGNSGQWAVFIQLRHGNQLYLCHRKLHQSGGLGFALNEYRQQQFDAVFGRIESKRNPILSRKFIAPTVKCFLHHIVTFFLEPEASSNLTLAMKKLRIFSNIFCHGVILALLLAAVSLTHASTIWNGPTNGFFHAVGGLSDEITTNVIITRGGLGGLYNSFLESGAVAGVSPKGTTWALGSLSNLSTLTFAACPLEMSERPPNDVGNTYVVHLLTNNIYLQLTLTNWGGAGSSGNTTFGYTRSSPTVPPVITSPSGGAVFGAPANVTIQASVAANVPIAFTNVQFYTNNVLLGSVSHSPSTLPPIILPRAPTP